MATILEANYRERLLNVYNEVKKRLDYQVSLQHLLRSREQEHMINWVEKGVVQSITPQQVKSFPRAIVMQFFLFVSRMDLIEIKWIFFFFF